MIIRVIPVFINQTGWAKQIALIITNSFQYE